MNLETIIYHHSGVPLLDEHTKAQITLQTVLTAVCTQSVPGIHLTLEEKLFYFDFWNNKVREKKETTITKEEREQIIKRMNVMYDSPLLVGQVYELLK